MSDNELLLAMSEMMDKKLQPINNRLDKIETDVSSLKTDVSSLKESNIKMEADIAALKIGQRELKKDMRVLKDKVSDTYDLALEAWGQSTENRTWLEKNQATG